MNAPAAQRMALSRAGVSFVGPSVGLLPAPRLHLISAGVTSDRSGPRCSWGRRIVRLQRGPRYAPGRIRFTPHAAITQDALPSALSVAPQHAQTNTACDGLFRCKCGCTRAQSHADGHICDLLIEPSTWRL